MVIGITKSATTALFTMVNSHNWSFYKIQIINKVIYIYLAEYETGLDRELNTVGKKIFFPKF